MVKSLRSTAGRLTARPTLPLAKDAPTGLRSLDLEAERDGLIYVPRDYRPERATPLVLMLHGAGGNAEMALSLLAGLADRYGLVLLAVSSQQRTWDVIVDDFVPDIAAIDRALAQTFYRYAIDAQHLAIAGFSDGASYALSVGLTNGQLFTHVMAFSPGFVVPVVPQGKPRLFIAHGTRDPVLPIDRCSRSIVPLLQQAGYAPVYQEFEGGHSVPAHIAEQAMDWLMGDRF
ncbi:phospholipase [filamentous cyanobacterium CCP4]|nr:phospholipase [filamentous cyanobacterium CCP4]